MVKLTAKQWEFYYSSMDCRKATRAINKRFNELLKEAEKKIATGKKNPFKVAEWVRDEMYEVLEKYREYGASDTEPRVILCSTIEKEMGLTKDSLWM